MGGPIPALWLSAASTRRDGAVFTHLHVELKGKLMNRIAIGLLIGLGLVISGVCVSAERKPLDKVSAKAQVVDREAPAAGREDRRQVRRPGRAWPHGPHDPRRHRLPQVTSIVFSPDGRRLAASYFVTATNRPGTDWNAWVAQWDLARGKRVTIGNAYGPIAFSADGRTIAMVAERWGRMWPQTPLALWRPGATKPFRVLKRREKQDSSVVAAAFHPDGKRLASITSPGEVLLWTISGNEQPTLIEKLASSGKYRMNLRLGPYPAPTLAFSPDGRSLLATIPKRRLRFGGHRAILWRFDVKTQAFKRAESYAGGLITRDASIVRLLDRLPRTGWAWAVAVKAGEPTRWVRNEGFGAYDHVRLAPDGEVLAASARGKVTIRRRDGKLLRCLPVGGGAVAFSADGKRLAAGGRRGIIHIWDVAGGRLLRTLRLDDRPPDTVLAAAIQCHSKFGDPPGNRKKLTRLVRRAASRGAKIVVLPEAAVTGYLSADLNRTWQVPKRPVSEGLTGVDPADAAEPVPGASTEIFSELAEQLGVYLTVPLVEVDRKTGSYYNTSVLFGPDGRMLIHYRKRDPWPWAERGWATPGDRGNPVVDTPFGRLGLLICYDIHGQARIMGRLKIDTLLYSVAWVDTKNSDWFAKALPGVAKANGFHIIAANWTVPKEPAPKWKGHGQSRIIDASGKLLAKVEGDLRDQIIYAELPMPAARARPGGGGKP